MRPAFLTNRRVHMRLSIVLPSALFAINVFTQVDARELEELKVLYVGAERTSTYANYLKDKVGHIETANRAAFKSADAEPFDVVLLDWPKGPDTRDKRNLIPPLGARDAWRKPTVLLGSAGMHLAVAWKIKGGMGCTCLQPLAYGLGEHEIFEQPLKIDRSRMVCIPTPADFKSEIKEPTINVLPLIDVRDRKWSSGWCTNPDDFAKNPDVEYFCGGVNFKAPNAAALWRQGNLLHFGFEQSPEEMNDQGRQLLLNSIVYISRFSEDRPIAVTPSPFVGPIARKRATLTHWLRNPEDKSDWVKDLVAPAIWEKLSALPRREQMGEWAAANAKFLHPNSNNKLEIDDDLVALGVAFDEPVFFDRTIAALRSHDAIEVGRARRLLGRYAANGPQDASADTWATWWTENQPYAFASDSGDYRWYIDPLAKARAIPSRELRGTKRADQMTQARNDSH